MRAAVAAAALLAATAAFAQTDGLKALESDPSPEASRRLEEILRRTKNPDQRFWLIRTLGVRLKDLADEAALETLLSAAGDKDPRVRAPALRALEGFSALPPEALRGRWLARLDAAAATGVKDSHPAVRQGAQGLEDVLRGWRRSPAAPSRAAPTATPAADGFEASRSLCWLWLLVFPVTAAAWRSVGLRLLGAGPEGGRARAAWGFLRGQPALLATSALGWALFSGLAAGLGFDLLVVLLGDPFYAPLRGWPKDLALAGLCLSLPGGLVAWVAARPPSRASGAALLQGLPWVAVASAAACSLLPFEAVYRLFFKRPNEAWARPPVNAPSRRWAAELGAVRAASIALAVSSAEGVGLLPALERAGALFPREPRPGLGLGSFDGRFVWLGAAPALAFFCVMFIHPRPVEWHSSLPVVLAGCTAWALGVTGGALWALAKTLEAAEAAGDALRALGRPSPLEAP